MALVKGLLDPREHAAYCILMHDAFEGGDFQHMVFDIDRGVIEASTGYVMLEVKPEESTSNRVYITDFMFQVSATDGQQYPMFENIHVPFPYIEMMNGISYLRVHHGIHKLTGEIYPEKLEIADYDQKHKIWIDDFKVGEKNNLTIKKPKMDKNLFGHDVAPSFMLFKYKKRFDNILEKLNKDVPYKMDQELTYALGTTERGYDFYLVTKTPLQVEY